MVLETKMETKIKLEMEFLIPFMCRVKNKIILIDYLKLKPKQFFLFQKTRTQDSSSSKTSSNPRNINIYMPYLLT
jgi:hypothetical protein